MALGIGGGAAFLSYAHRTIGINQEWAGEPQFQWRIYGTTSDKGKPIPTDSWVALVNEKVEPEADFLVYLNRPAGAVIGWTTSPNWIGAAKDWLTKEAFHTSFHEVKR